ncbi:restriction endonuclease [Corynebacterium glutamicum]|uniref:restriction endonuclease n=1 Tax=Corynebacterium glutamicum TaxID=1718 RepID=UPI00155E1771|nr:restriction endonuclease [Corynebacterium glutamicum]
MLPVLNELSQDQIVVRRDLIESVAKATGITEEDRKQFISSGQPTYVSRISWAITYLHRAQCLDRPQRAYYSINDLGRKLQAHYPEGISQSALAEFAQDHGIQDPSGVARVQVDQGEGGVEKQEVELTPTEQIEAGLERLHAGISADLLERLRNNAPVFFEQAVLDLLIAMGYGGTSGSATRTQLSNDGGIDGVIDQDALGISRIYVQAKRYSASNKVGRPEVQAFVGALHGVQANQGVFFTTGAFTDAAIAYANSLNARVVLIDGERLAKLMIRFGVGVQVQQVVKIVEVDEDFFE